MDALEPVIRYRPNTPGMPQGDGYTPFPNFLFSCDLDPDEAIVLMGLIRLWDTMFEAETQEQFPNDMDHLVACCFGLPRATIVRIMARLEDRGFISNCGRPGIPDAVILTFCHHGDLPPANLLSCPSIHYTADVKEHAEIYHRYREYTERLRRLVRIDELASMPYDEYLLTPEWKARRLVEIERAKGRCELCNATGPFHVHHRTYERRGDEAPGDLLALCAPCHESFHQHRSLA